MNWKSVVYDFKPRLEDTNDALRMVTGGAAAGGVMRAIRNNSIIFGLFAFALIATMLAMYFSSLTRSRERREDNGTDRDSTRGRLDARSCDRSHLRQEHRRFRER